MKDYVLELDRPRKLRFGFKFLRLIRERFGEKGIKSFLNLGIEELPVIVHAGLVWEDETLTVEKVEKLLDEKIPEKYKIIDIAKIIGEALLEQVGAPNENSKIEVEAEKKIQETISLAKSEG